MKKTALIIAFAAVAVLVVGFAGAQGYQGNFGNSANTRPVDFHNQMYGIMENGTYSDLETFREEYGFNVMPWVDGVEEFELAQEMHEQMEEYRTQNTGIGRGYGMMGQGRGAASQGGCPMRGGFNQAQN